MGGGYQRLSSFKRRIDKRIGGHRVGVARLAAMVAADIQSSKEKQGERERGENGRQRESEREREGEKERERADGKSTEEHDETTWQQGIARRTAQGSPRVLYLPMDRAGEPHMQGRQ